METPLYSKSDAVRFGWEQTKKNLRVFGWLGAAGAFVWLLQQSLNRTADEAPLLNPLLSVALQALLLAIQLMFVRAALRVHDGLPVNRDELFAALPRFFNFLLASVLYGLIVAAGMILLIVPGVIWAVKFGFYGYAIVDEDVDPLEALKRSSALTDGRKKDLTLFGLLLLGINVVGAMALGIGLIVTVPTTAIAGAYVYRRLAATRPAKSGKIVVASEQPATP